MRQRQTRAGNLLEGRADAVLIPLIPEHVSGTPDVVHGVSRNEASDGVVLLGIRAVRRAIPVR